MSPVLFSKRGGLRAVDPSPLRRPPSPTGQGGPLPAIDGRGLLSLNARRLGELFEGPMRQARLQHEGEAWAIGVDDEGDGPEADLTRAAPVRIVGIRPPQTLHYYVQRKMDQTYLYY